MENKEQPTNYGFAKELTFLSLLLGVVILIIWTLFSGCSHPQVKLHIKGTGTEVVVETSAHAPTIILANPSSELPK